MTKQEDDKDSFLCKTVGVQYLAADLQTKRKAADNRGFAIAGVPCSAGSFEVAKSFVLRRKFSSKNPTHRQARVSIIPTIQ